MAPTSSSRPSVDSVATMPGSARESSFLRQSYVPPTPTSRSRRGSTASSIHSLPSVGGTLDTFGGAGTVIESGQNAISTLLQPPIVRTGRQPLAAAPVSSAHKPPTSRDIPPVTLTNIPHVDVGEFRPYISKVGALYEQLQRAKESEDQAAAAALGPQYNRRASGRIGDWGDAPDEGHLKPSSHRRVPLRKGSTASLASVASLDLPRTVRRPSSGLARKVNQGPPPLSTIPNVYLEEDFHLENPRTFDIVSERSEVVQQPADGRGPAPNGHAAPRRTLATNAILQEKLSWYMDTIEVHLINSISTASTTFFSALGSLRELHTEAADSVDRIKALRNDLQALDAEIATTGLDILQKRRRMANMQKLSDAILQLRTVVDGVVQSEALVDAGEMDEALDKIEMMEALIAGEPEPPPNQGPSQGSSGLIDLRGSRALQTVGGDLETLRLRTGKAYEAKFVAALLADLRKHVDGVAMNEVLMRWNSASQRAKGAPNRVSSMFPTYTEQTGELRAAIKPVIIGLARSRHITAATTAYRDAVMREVRNIVRRPLPSSSDDDAESIISASTRSKGRTRSNQERSSVLARNLRALLPGDAEKMLSHIYVKFAEAIRRVTTQVKVLLDVASSLTEDGPGGPGLKSPPFRSPLPSPRPDQQQQLRRGSVSGFEIQEELHLAMELPKLMNRAVDVAQEKVVKILRVRTEQTRNLSLHWFLRYYSLNVLFVNECEAISGQGSPTLKALVTGHIKEFVQQHGESEKVKLADGMELDMWGAKDFGESDTALLNDILACSTKDPPSWTERTNVWQPYNGGEEAGGQAAGALTIVAAASAAASTASLEDNGDKKKEKEVRLAVIDDASYILPDSALLCLRGMTRFLHLMSGIPLMTSDVATTLVAYLQSFNSRCTQLILGAGATRSVGLKNIAAKHLALASQALGFIAALIPHVREFVRRNLGAATAVSGGGLLMGEFDKVRHLMQEHQDSIYQKIVEIMRNRAGVAVRAMKKVDWDAPGSGPDSVHAYVEGLSKDTSILHRVLTRHLPEASVQMIMYPVFESYKEQFGRALREATPTTEAGRDGMIRDIEYIISRVSKIDGFGDMGEYLLRIIKAKEVARATPPSIPPSVLPSAPPSVPQSAPQSAGASFNPSPQPGSVAPPDNTAPPPPESTAQSPDSAAQPDSAPPPDHTAQPDSTAIVAAEPKSPQEGGVSPSPPVEKSGDGGGNSEA